MDGDFSLARHLDAIAARTRADGQRLADDLLGATWPGGHHDRSERGALDWVRRWRPRTVAIETAACSCAAGRCVVCN